eukprot:TRINITY_DN27089_c0_g1_i2.p1 TRINITY_DN27089_c0_g1~~TRINITY_DN27089_c0_g1_i2.p1  ORF type:complete len:377 (-),score=116.31 TRINITY_DN27089_c0_g1_i2:141-1271(-)
MSDVESSSLGLTESDDETDDEELGDLELDSLEGFSADAPKQVVVTVESPGQKLGMSLAAHPSGTCVHATATMDPKKLAAVGKVAAQIVSGPGRGKSRSLLGLSPDEVARAIGSVTPPYSIVFEDPKPAARASPPQKPPARKPPPDNDSSDDLFTATDGYSPKPSPKNTRSMKKDRRIKNSNAAARRPSPPAKAGQSPAMGVELAGLKQKLIAAEKMNGAQAKLIATLKEKEKAEAEKMRKLWEEEKQRWQGKEEALEQRVKSAYAEGEESSAKVGEVSELLEMLQAETANNEKVKANLKIKADADLEQERARITALREQDLKEFEAKELAWKQQIESNEQERKALVLQAEATLEIETTKINEAWRKDKSALSLIHI